MSLTDKLSKVVNNTPPLGGTTTEFEMVEKEESTTFLLRNVERGLWGRVKHKAYEEGLTIREYIILLLKKDTASWQEKTGTGR